MVFKNALIILIIYFLFQPGMLLFGFSKVLSRLPWLLRKPLFECMICMSSVWGITYFLYKQHTHTQLFLSKTIFLSLAEHVLVLGGIMVILDSAIGFLRRNSGTITERLK